MNYSNAVQKALAYIQHNLAGDVSLSRVARHVCYSPSHFNRLFSAETGQTLHRYVRAQRLERAAAELAHTAKPVLEIGLDAGYGSQSAFTLAFRQRYGTAPQAYRLRAHKAVSAIPYSTLTGGKAA